MVLVVVANGVRCVNIFVIMHFICTYTYSSITYQQNDYLSVNGCQKTKEMSKFKNCKFQKENKDGKIYTIYHSHFDYEKYLNKMNR